MASNRLDSHASTCLRAAAWRFPSPPRVARCRRGRSRTSPIRKRSCSASRRRRRSSDCLSSSRLKRRIAAGRGSASRRSTSRGPNEPVAPGTRKILLGKSNRGGPRDCSVAPAFSRNAEKRVVRAAMDDETQELRAQQARRERTERREAAVADDPAEEHAHTRRADKAAYLREKLEARAEA